MRSRRKKTSIHAPLEGKGVPQIIRWMGESGLHASLERKKASIHAPLARKSIVCPGTFDYDRKWAAYKKGLHIYVFQRKCTATFDLRKKEEN